MKKWRALLVLIPVLGVFGCEPLVKTSTITGRVTDENGLPVRDAHVWTADGSTQTTSNGAFVLPGNRNDFVTVKADFVQSGVTFRGQNVARAVQDQVQTSINITIAPVSRLAKIHGTVKDRDGFLLSGVSVFAFMGGNLSSVRAVTNDMGEYELPDLVSGVTYELSAGNYGYSNDETSLTLSAHEDRAFNFVVDNAGFPTLPAPTNLGAIAWTSPALSRDAQAAQAYENLKRLYDKKRASRLPTGRATSMGNPIEIQLDWDRLSGPDFYGYGIYRGTGSGSIGEYDFYREPLAGTYIDGDPNFVPGLNYRYQITALGTLFPDDPDSEGPRSAIVSAQTLNDMVANEVPLTGPVSFSWQAGSGASEYVVYLFDRYPGIGVESIWNNENNPTSQMSLNYSGAALVTGHTYYYMVLGLANGTDSRTISEVKQFTY